MKSILIVVITIMTLYANLTINNSELFKLNIDENLTISGNLNITTTSTLLARENSSINLDKNWVNDGNFTASTSTVSFIGSALSTILGNTIFYNFISNKDTTFESNKTQEITNIFRLKDGVINSTISGLYSTINLATVEVIDTNNLTIKDSKIIGRVAALNPPSSTDNGNNLLWFSPQNECQNAGSGYEWFDKLTCQNNTTTYLTDKNSSLSQTSFLDSVNVVVTANNEKVLFNYEAPANIGSPCSKDIEVQLHNDATITTGYKGCSYEDPTLKNWSEFDSAKVVIKDTTGSSNSVIVIDVNLKTRLIIGGSNAN